MASATKIFKATARAELTELEALVNKQLLELEATSKEFASELKTLQFVTAKEIKIANATSQQAKEAIVIFVPYTQHGAYKAIQNRLTRELEKKFSGKHVLFVAQRTIYSKSYKRVIKGQVRPRSRTLTSVHNSILEDLVHPTQIVGKRVRNRLDGSQLIKIFLDPKDTKEVEDKLNTFNAVYKKLTNKNVAFSLPPVSR